MSRLILISILLSSTLLFHSCRKGTCWKHQDFPQIECDSGFSVESNAVVVMGFAINGAPASSPFIINDSTTYESLFDEDPFGGAVDFTQHSVIWFENIIGQGESPRFQSHVCVDHLNKRVHFAVYVTVENRCQAGVGGGGGIQFYARIPKITSDYQLTTEFIDLNQ